MLKPLFKHSFCLHFFGFLLTDLSGFKERLNRKQNEQELEERLDHERGKRLQDQVASDLRPREC